MNALADRPNDIPQEFVKRWSLPEVPEAATCPFRAADGLRAGPDIFYNLLDEPRNLGAPGHWIVARHSLQKEILQNPEVFSSRRIAGFSALIGEDWPLVPLELDPPEHGQYRDLVNPLFSPRRINELEGGVREAAIELIEVVRKQGGCEFMEAFGRPFPVGVFMRLMGLPLEDMPTFLDWEENLLRGPSMEARISAATSINSYLLDLIATRRRKPTDDLVSFAIKSELDGKPWSDERVLGFCYLLFVGGLDTVAAVLGFSFREMAMRPEQQREIRASAEIVPHAVEEYLRAFGVVQTSRYLTRDFEFHGFKWKKGERVVIHTSLGSRDDTFYDNPHEIDFHRRETRHLSLAAGPHRCLGAHLARRELSIALEEWARRVPEFRITNGEQTVVHALGVMGVDHLPLSW